MNSLIVHLHGRRVGVQLDYNGRLTFRYDDAWLVDGKACQLSRQLPLSSKVFSDPKVGVFFGGLLPEADARKS